MNINDCYLVLLFDLLEGPGYDELLFLVVGAFWIGVFEGQIKLLFLMTHRRNCLPFSS